MKFHAQLSSLVTSLESTFFPSASSLTLTESGLLRFDFSYCLSYDGICISSYDIKADGRDLSYIMNAI